MIVDEAGNAIELGRAGEATILSILAKSMADNKLSRPAFDLKEGRLIEEVIKLILEGS